MDDRKKEEVEFIERKCEGEACMLLDWYIDDKQILGDALKELLRIRGEDKELALICDTALDRGNIT